MDMHGYNETMKLRLPPIVMGHEEAAGTVEAGAARCRIFVWAILLRSSTISCGKCFTVAAAWSTCAITGSDGSFAARFSPRGAFAEHRTKFAHRVLHSPRHAVCACSAYSSRIRRISLTSIALEDPVVPMGAGMIGLATLRAVVLAALAGSS